MDQVKVFLRQCIKHRFWIAVSLAVLLSMTGYFLGVSPIRAEADKKTGEIISAEKDVRQYSGLGLPNAQYKPIINEKTQVLGQDVTASWKKLYARQAPLLTWPEVVESRFQTWGRKWPENVDSSAVLAAIIDYVQAYPTEVTSVYKSFNPFDPVEGTGVVAAPPEDLLLRPAKFPPETPPVLGKVWAAQERLWIQRTLLDVIAKVNGDVKTWDNAVIKQVIGLEVGTATAQDQRSIAKGDTLEESIAIDDPAKPAEPEAEAGSGGGMEGMMRMMGGNSGGPAATETVSHIKPETENARYTIMPVQMTVLIDQDRIPDLLVAMENSPMSIQVRDFEMTRPTTRVTKPEKGVGMMGYDSMMGGGGMDQAAMMRSMMNMMGGRHGMTGYGGNAMAMQQSMMGMMNMNGGMGGGAAARPVKKGVDVRNENRAKDEAKRLEAAKKVHGNPLHDPYFYIVQVKVSGQARFFSPPPAETAPTPSEAATATPAPAPAAGDAAKTAETPKPDAAAPAADAAKTADATKKDETPAADAAKTVETPKADAAAKDATKKDETPKADAAAKKDDAPKADEAAKTAETPKADDATKKDDAPKAKDEAKK